jgi:hypothetical protein
MPGPDSKAAPPRKAKPAAALRIFKKTSRA